MALPLVSVILPVHNVSQYLDRCLDSLLQQSIGFDTIEVIAVDDGSTDDSGDKLDAFAAGRRNVTVIHQPNSGGPGGPRNKGIEVSRGEYLFFVDPDDYLGVEAIERMYQIARRNDSDIVLGKMVGVGRRVPAAPFRRHLERADLYTSNAIWSMHSMKLFRRALVQEHGLRFLEGVRLGEDQEFVVGAYLRARTFSVVADYDCYYLVRRDDGQNAVHAPVDPRQLYDVVRRVIELVISGTQPGPARNRLLARCFRAEVLGKAAGRHFLEWEPEVRSEFVRHAGALIDDYLPDELLAELPAVDRLRAYFLRHGLQDELAEVISFEVAGAPPPPVVRAGRLYGRFPFFGDSRYGIPDHYFDITGELHPRQCREQVSWDGRVLRVSWDPLTPLLAHPRVEWGLVLQDGSDELVFSGEPAPSLPEVAIDVAAVEAMHGPGPRRWHALTQVCFDGLQQRKRVGQHGTLESPPELLPGVAGGHLVSPYLTRHGHLVVETRPVRPGQLYCEVEELGWDLDDRAHLVLTGRLGLDDGDLQPASTLVLVLRARGSADVFEVPADHLCRTEVPVRSIASVPAEPVSWRFSGAVDLRSLASPPRPARALWDLSLHVRRGGVVHRARVALDPARVELPRPALCDGRAVIPYATVHGNLSLDVGEVARHVEGRAQLTRAEWDDEEPRLHLRGHVAPPAVEGGGTWSMALVLRGDDREVTVPLHRAISARPDERNRPGTLDESGYDVEGTVDVRLLARPGRRLRCRWHAYVRLTLRGFVHEAPLKPARGGEKVEAPSHTWRERPWNAYRAAPRLDDRTSALSIVLARQLVPAWPRALARGIRRRAKGRHENR